MVALYEDSTVTLNDQGVILKAFSWRLKDRWVEIKHTGFIRAGFSPEDCALVSSVLLENGVLEKLLARSPDRS